MPSGDGERLGVFVTFFFLIWSSNSSQTFRRAVFFCSFDTPPLRTPISYRQRPGVSAETVEVDGNCIKSILEPPAI